MRSGLMRSNLLVLVSLVFMIAGTASLVLGVAVLIDNARDLEELTDWVGVNLGLAILSTTALWLFMLGVLAYMTALLAYIANTLADALDRMPQPQVDTAPRPVLSEQPSAPWYTQTPMER